MHLRSKLILHLYVRAHLLARSRAAVVSCVGSCLNARIKVFLVTLALVLGLVHDLAGEHSSGLAESGLLLLLIIIITSLVLIRLLHINIINVLLSNLLNIFWIVVLHLCFVSFPTIDVSSWELELSTLLVFRRDISLLRGDVSIAKNVRVILAPSGLF